MERVQATSGRDWNGNRGHVVDRTHGGCAQVCAGLARRLQGRDIKGIVFQRPDGRMAKVKAAGFRVDGRAGEAGRLMRLQRPDAPLTAL